MSHPFQTVCTIPKCLSPDHSDAVIAACGPEIISIHPVTGKIISRWAPNIAKSDTQSNANSTTKDDAAQQPRGKKRKHGQIESTQSGVIKLQAISGQRRFIAVTGEDKCIRVFDVAEDGTITQQSERNMPKRPCAIATDTEGKTIFCCDKFGDVYSLPVYHDPAAISTAAKEETPVPEKVYVPAATSKTVHTQRNRRALEDQMKAKGQKLAVKEGLKFEHQLLLGHVSMLTDMVYATIEISGKQAPYLITADRDEHIRITRGPPQTHVIERFCLGHTEFVSKICLISGTNLLMSGGGDDWLGVWDRTTGELLAKHSLRLVYDLALRERKPLPEGEKDDIAISGLHVVPVSEGQERACVLVALEKQNFAVMYDSADLLDAEVQPTVKNFKDDGVLLDVTTIGNTVVASFDTRSVSRDASRLKAYTILQGPAGLKLKEAKDSSWLNEVNTRPNDKDVDDKALDSLLYSINNLRKRDSDDANDDA